MNVLFNYSERNTKEKTDFMWKEIELLGKDTIIYIASAFFSNSDLINKLINNNCEIRLIIRLNSGTSGAELKKIINNDMVSIRYYTSETFHPKIYIFGQHSAIIGSSNLTKSGVQSNQEANIMIRSEEIVFEDIEKMFQEYWTYAEVLNNDILDIFLQIEDEVSAAKNRYNEKIKNQLKEVVFPNIYRGIKKKKRDEIFKSDFKKQYQLFLNKHKQLEEIYLSELGKKSKLPDRIEIDRFLNWIRDKKAIKKTYANMPIRNGQDLRSFIIENKNEYFMYNDKYLIETEEVLFPRVNNAFESLNSINTLDKEDLYKSLLVVNAFAAQERYKGGSENSKKIFFDENKIENIKKSLTYLLFDKANYVDRITNCIFDDKYLIKGFRKSCLKELYGLVNKNNVPICNERTLVCMQYLGFGNIS